LDQREEQPAGRRAVLGRRGDVGYLARWRIDRRRSYPKPAVQHESMSIDILASVGV